jgi:hypothetical protein
MKFDELDGRLRGFETAHDLCVPPGLYVAPGAGEFAKI